MRNRQAFFLLGAGLCLGLALAGGEPSTLECRKQLHSWGWVRNATSHQVANPELFRPRLRKPAGEVLPIKLRVMVPVYREWNSGNLLRLLESFARQTVDPRYFEILLLVNNSSAPEVRAFLENQKTLYALVSLRMFPTLAPRFLDPIWKRPTWKKITQRPVEFEFWNASTDGMRTHMGEIRAALARLALGRPHAPREKGLLGLMDADCTVPPNYVEEILLAFLTRPIEAVFLNIDFSLDSGSDLRQVASHHQFRADFLLNRLSMFLRSDLRFHVGAPQIVASESAYHKVHGIPRKVSMEDGKFSSALSGQLPYSFLDSVFVTSSDRARRDGFIAAQRLELLEKDDRYRVRGNENLGALLLAAELDRRLSWERVGEIETARQIFESYGAPFSAKAWNCLYDLLFSENPQVDGNFFRGSWGDGFLLACYMLVEDKVEGRDSAFQRWRHIEGADYLIDAILPRLNVSELAEYHALREEEEQREKERAAFFDVVLGQIAENTARGRRASRGVSPEGWMKHGWLAPLLTQIRDQRKRESRTWPSGEGIQQRFREVYPHFALDPENQNLSHQILTLRAFLRLAQRATMEPSRYPGLSGYLHVSR